MQGVVGKVFIQQSLSTVAPKSTTYTPIPVKARHAGRVVLITGASSGIGWASARHLAARGYRVYGTSRHATLRPQPDDAGVVMVRMDVDDEASVAAGVMQVLEAEGRIDVLVNNAGISLFGALEDTTVEEVKAQFETNFFGAWRVCRAVLPAMRAQRGGYIINISSIGGLMGLPFQATYSASKFALEGMSEALSIELKPFGIHVILIEPGDLATEITEHRRKAKGSSEGASVYRNSCKRALEVTEAAERAGPAPGVVAELLEKVLTSTTPRLRYTVGSLTEQSGVTLKRLLPGRLFEQVLMRAFGLHKKDTFE